MVKVYSMDSCPWCVKVKNYLKSKDILFKDLNVQDDMDAREEMIKKSNQLGVPVLDIDGTIIIGFDRKAIDSAINSSTDE